MQTKQKIAKKERNRKKQKQIKKHFNALTQTIVCLAFTIT